MRVIPIPTIIAERARDTIESYLENQSREFGLKTPSIAEPTTKKGKPEVIFVSKGGVETSKLVMRIFVCAWGGKLHR